MELTRTTILKKEKFSQILCGIFAFLLGISELTGGVLPFGQAFLCASPRRMRKSIFIGVLTSSIFDECIPLALFSAVFCYFVLTAKEKSESLFVGTRILLAFSLSALRVTYIALGGVEGMNDVFRVVASVIAYPTFTLAFLGYFDRKRELYPKRYDCALLSFAFAFSLLLYPIEIGGISLSLIPATAFTLCAARTRGFGFGGVCGIVCGLVSGGAATGALGVLGMTYGLLASEIESMALVLSFMVAVSGYFYLSGIEGTVAAMLMMAAVYAVFIPLRSRLQINRSAESSAEKRAHDRRISRYAQAFSSLSSLFYTVSENTKTESITALNKSVVARVDKHCEHCVGCELDKSEITNFFTSELRNHGIAAYARIPSHISAICPHAAAMARSVNRLSVERERDGEKGLMQMGDEFSAVSSLLIDAAKKQEDRAKNDRALAEKIKSALSEAGVECDGARVVGSRLREMTIYGVKPDRIKKSPTELSNAISSVVGTAVSEPELILHDDYTLMRFRTVPMIRIECAKFSEAKNGETVCGDTVSVFENEERYFYCLVSDGMGSGRDAALTSRLSAIMLEKLLTVGADKSNALKLLNKALLEKNEEVFATVDLLEIDRITGRATLLKAGAAPTLLIRNGKSKQLESRTPPAGIMKKVIAEKKSFRLEKGDMIVMLSDGILQTGSDFRLFGDGGIPALPTARAMATKILRESRRNTELSDDMSVCVLHIK